MFMENRIKILIITLILFYSCNTFQKQEEEVKCDIYTESAIYFKGFNNLKINKIAVIDCKDSTNNCDYIKPELDNTDDYNLMRLSINSLTNNSLVNGCEIIVNDNLKYKITNLKVITIEHNVGLFWDKKIYDCKLKEYKINDSLIKDCNVVTIYK